MITVLKLSRLFENDLFLTIKIVVDQNNWSIPGKKLDYFLKKLYNEF